MLPQENPVNSREKSGDITGEEIINLKLIINLKPVMLSWLWHCTALPCRAWSSAGGGWQWWHWHWATMQKISDHLRQSHITISPKKLYCRCSWAILLYSRSRMTNSIRLNWAEDLYCQPLTSQYSLRALQFVSKGLDLAWSVFWTAIRFGGFRF